MTQEKPTKKTVLVHGRRVADHERGTADAVPAWQPDLVLSLARRHSALDGVGWFVAPDLIGIGDSQKLPNPGPDTYRFVTHRDRRRDDAISPTVPEA